MVQELLATVHGISPQMAAIGIDALQGKSQVQAAAFLSHEASPAYLTLETELRRVSEELQQTHGVSLSGLEDEAEADTLAKLSPEKVAEITHPLRRIERDILLSVIDSRWIDYLHNLDGLREGIGLRAYGQKDPLIEY